MLKCEFCNKTFKTEKGYEKHLCEKKKRWVNFNNLAYSFYCDFLTYSHTKISSDMYEQKKKFIKSSLYKDFVNFADWIKESNIIEPHLYVKWLSKQLVCIRDWSSIKTYHCFLYDYLRKEDNNSAIERSINFLTKRGETIETIAPYDLYIALYYGYISYKYIKDQNFDYKSVIEIVITREELSQLEYFLEGV